MFVGGSAQVRGTLEKGQVVLGYGSQQELESLLILLGVNETEIPNFPEEDGPEVPRAGGNAVIRRGPRA